MPYSRPRRVWSALPLRMQLTIWNALIVLAIALAALLTVRIGLKQMLLKELRDALADEALEISLTADRFVEDPSEIYAHLETTAEGHLRHGWFLQLFRASSPLAEWNSDNAPPMLRAAPPDGKNESVVADGVEYRIVERRISAPQEPERWVRVGSSVTIIEEDIRNVTRVILPVMLGLAILAPLGGYLAASRATAPLRDILSTTKRLHPRSLDERLPVRGVGDELDQLSAEINEFLDQIGSHLERNRDFVAHAAHELRSPLTAIMAALDVTLTQRRTAEEYEELMTELHDKCGQLTGLIQKLLLLAESDAGILGAHREPVLLATVVEASLSLYDPLADERDVTVSSQLAHEVWVMGDAVWLRQVVNNLLDNALKFAGRGGTVHVRLDAATSGTIRLEVLNSAENMTDAHMSRVFDRFYRGPTGRQPDVSRGTGLGLSICKAIIESYDGSIAMESRSNQTVAVVVELPICELIASSATKTM